MFSVVGVDGVFLSHPVFILVLVGEQFPELGEPAGLYVGLDGGGGARVFLGFAFCLHGRDLR